MKLVYFDDFKLGVLRGDQVVDVSQAVSDIPHSGPGDLISGVIEHWDQYKGKIEDAATKGQGVPVSGVRLRPPLPKPTNVDCMAVNYMENGTRSAPAPINAFHKSASGIIGDGDTMVLPDAAATIFEGEAELALVIGKAATDVSQADAMDHIFGYINLIDGSARGLGPDANTFFMMKSRETFCPIGPYLVTKDEIADPLQLHVQLWNNGELKQDYNTSDMAHKIPRCIEWLSSIHTLQPGDIVACGTNHRGLHAFQDGDKIELEVEGLGRLHIDVRDDLKRKWGRETRLEMQAKGINGTTPQVAGKYAQVPAAGD